MKQSPIKFDCVAGASAAFLARHRHVDGTYAIPANTSAIAVNIKRDGVTQTHSGSIDPTSPNLFTELQTDDERWPIDANDGSDIGFNFVWTSPLTAFPAQGHYRVEFTFTHTDATVSKLVYEGTARSTNG